MSHFTVLVIGPDPEKQLAPYDENLEVEAYEEDGETYHRNPKAKWDWYSLGGRWTGYLKLKPWAGGETGRPGILTEPAKPGYADQTILRNVDVAGMRDEAEAKAAERYDEMMRLTGGAGVPAITEAWEALVEREDAALRAKGIRPASDAPTLAQVAREWHKAQVLRKGERSTHAWNVMGHVDTWLSALAETRVSEITPGAVQKVVDAYLEAPGNTPGGANAVLRSLSLLIGFAVKRDSEPIPIP